MKNIKTLLTALLFSFPLFSSSIYETIEILPFSSSGYFATEGSLDKIFRSQSIKSVIEVGCWAGAATRFFGNRVGEEGKVYAVDHWLGTPNNRGEMTDAHLPHIYQLFLSNIYHFHLTERVIPIRMTSAEAAKALHVKADLIYIDAARDAEGVYKTIIEWYPHLNEQGVICGAEIREPQVRSGVQRAAEQLGKTVHTDQKGYFWSFE